MPLNIPESKFRRKKSKKYTKKLNKKFKLDNKLVTGILSTFGIVAIIVIILLVIYIKNTIQDANIRQMENATIIEVKRGDVVRNVEGRGTIEAINHYDITSLVDGDILEDYFEEGQMVEKGDLLYLISHTELDKNIKKVTDIKRISDSFLKGNESLILFIKADITLLQGLCK